MEYPLLSFVVCMNFVLMDISYKIYSAVHEALRLRSSDGFGIEILFMKAFLSKIIRKQQNKIEETPT